MSIYSAIQDFPLELQGPVKHLVDEIRKDVITPLREDFSELKGLVTKLAEAQIRTENRLESLENKVGELAEAQKGLAEAQKGLAEAQKKTEERVEELAEAQKKTEERVEELAEEVRKGFKQLNVKIDTISTRSGRNNEDTIRNALETILKIANFKVKREHIKDNEIGEFELDIVIYDGFTIIVEVKSYVNYSDVYYFNKCVDKYIQLTRKTIDRKIFISPDVNLNAYEYGKELGIEFVSCWLAQFCLLVQIFNN